MAEQRTLTSIQIESEALIGGVISAGVGVLVGFFAFWGKEPALSDPGAGGWSVGMVAALTAGLSAFVCSLIGYWRVRRQAEQAWRRSLTLWQTVVDFLAVALAHMIVIAVLVYAMFAVLQASFRGLQIDQLWGTVSVAVAAGLAGYVVQLSVAALSSVRLVSLLVVFLLVSSLASMVAAPEPKWWIHNFSRLGTYDTPSAWLFNFSLVAAGLLLMCFALYLNRDLRTIAEAGQLHTPSAPAIMSAGFLLTGMCIIGAGLVPVNRSILVHNIFATGMLVVVMAIISLSGWLLLGLPWQVLAMTYGFLAALALTIVLWAAAGYFSFTAMEFTCFTLVFGWISVFIRMISAQVEYVRSERTA